MMPEELDIGIKLNHPTFAPVQTFSPTPASEAANDDTDDQDEEEEDIDDDSEDKDYSMIYEKFQKRFNRVYETSHSLFEQEKSQRQSLTYFQQRNNALLKLIEEFDHAGPRRNVVEPLSIETATRVSMLIQRVTRLQQKLAPLLRLVGGSEFEVDKQHLINLYINEKIPEEINDDISSIERNPQDIVSWCRRNYPDLVLLDYKPTDIPVKGLRAEYINSELVLDTEGMEFDQISIGKRKAPGETGPKKKPLP